MSSKGEKPVESPKRKINKYANVPVSLEVVAGLCSGFFVAPFNTIVDKSIIENANGRMPLWKGVG